MSKTCGSSGLTFRELGLGCAPHPPPEGQTPSGPMVLPSRNRSAAPMACALAIGSPTSPRPMGAHGTLAPLMCQQRTLTTPGRTRMETIPLPTAAPRTSYAKGESQMSDDDDSKHPFAAHFSARFFVFPRGADDDGAASCGSGAVIMCIGDSDALARALRAGQQREQS